MRVDYLQPSHTHTHTHTHRNRHTNRGLSLQSVRLCTYASLSSSVLLSVLTCRSSWPCAYPVLSAALTLRQITAHTHTHTHTQPTLKHICPGSESEGWASLDGRLIHMLAVFSARPPVCRGVASGCLPHGCVCADCQFYRVNRGIYIHSPCASALLDVLNCWPYMQDK